MERSFILSKQCIDQRLLRNHIHKKFILLLILIMVSFEIFSQNVMLIPNTNGFVDETITVSLDINNTDDFVSFQTNIILPENVEYIPESAVLTSRAADHSLNATLHENNILQVFSFSFNNNFFLGNEGSVMEFQINSGNTIGEFLIELSNPIIGNEFSQNIITGYENGELIIIELLPPSNISINFDNENIYITWEPVEGADSYSVFSSEYPYSDFEFWFLEQEGITVNAWNERISNEKKFYFIKANY